MDRWIRSSYFGTNEKCFIETVKNFKSFRFQKGALQGYNFGVKLRKRYKNLLPSNGFYTTNEMFVRSSAAERCLMTAQSFLAGLLPPNKDHHNLPIQWQPVAINSEPRDRDKVTAGNRRHNSNAC